LVRRQDLCKFVQERRNSRENLIGRSVLESLKQTSNFWPAVRAKCEAYTGELLSDVLHFEDVRYTPQ
jgi:hypothetical protein